METQLETIKDFLLNKLPTELAKLETTDVSLPALTEKDIVIGTIDINKYENPVLCSILPENEVESEVSLEETLTANEVTISMLFRKSNYNVLVKRMLRYSEALRNALLADYSLDDKCVNSEIGERRFFYDCGTGPQTMTAFEFTLTIEM